MKILIAVLFVSLLLFGCSSQQQTPTQQPSQQTTQTSQPETQQAQQLSANPIDNLLSAFKQNNGWKVTYDFKYSESLGSYNAYEMTQYVQGTGKFRADLYPKGEKVTSHSYVIGNDGYGCGKNQELWTCYALLDRKIVGDEPYTVRKDLEQDYIVTADGTMQVADTTATCYNVAYKSNNYWNSPYPSNWTSLYCISSDGVPLYVKTIQTVYEFDKILETEMTATSYGTTVSDADFLLPAIPKHYVSDAQGGSYQNVENPPPSIPQ